MPHYLRANSKHSQSDSFGMKSLFLAQKEAPSQSLLRWLLCIWLTSQWGASVKKQLLYIYVTYRLTCSTVCSEPLSNHCKVGCTHSNLCLLQKLTSHLAEKVKHGTYVTARLSHNSHTDGIAKINLCLFATCYKNSLIALTDWNNHCIFPLNIASWIQ